MIQCLFVMHEAGPRDWLIGLFADETLPAGRVLVLA